LTLLVPIKPFTGNQSPVLEETPFLQQSHFPQDAMREINTRSPFLKFTHGATQVSAYLPNFFARHRDAPMLSWPKIYCKVLSHLWVKGWWALSYMVILISACNCFPDFLHWSISIRIDTGHFTRIFPIV